MTTVYLYIMLAVPLLTAAACWFVNSERLTGYIGLIGSAILCAAAFPVVSRAVGGPITAMDGMLYVDALSSYILSIVVLLSLASSAYSIHYIEHEMESGLTDSKGMRRYYLLLHLFVFTMLLVLVCNNLALMWIAIEATTIVSAVLIGLGYMKRPLAIEAAWKYIVLCTVGITFALLGIFIAYYASIAVTEASAAALGNSGAARGTLNWTELKQMGGALNPATMKLCFVFVLIGYGTKAGLAPVHNWLPDAHSQAPSPISALLSGILLNTSFYGIMRIVSVVSPSTGADFTGGLLITFGLISIGIAAVFILVQDNFKRLLAYSSIEHMGIITLGIGIGGAAAVYGSLLHILNHALAKPLMFYATGRVQAKYGSAKIEDVGGLLKSRPLLGGLLLIGALALAGTPPFNVFISEFTVLTAAASKAAWWPVGLFLLFAAVVFYGMLSGFSRILFGSPRMAERKSGGTTASMVMSDAVMVVLALLIIALGVYIPNFIDYPIMRCLTELGVY